MTGLVDCQKALFRKGVQGAWCTHFFGGQCLFKSVAGSTVSCSAFFRECRHVHPCTCDAEVEDEV